jgi:type IV fimbrial biogenesis protein FimT
MSSPAWSRGFTITELLIVVTIAGILMAAALPAYNDFVRNQRVKTASFDVFSSLVYARSEAVTRNASVTVTPAGGNWASGWTVTDIGGTVLRSQEALTAITITGGVETATSTTRIVYSGTGRLSSAVTPIQVTATGTGITTRCISMDLSGRPVTKAAAC